MTVPGQTPRVFRFGPFELEPETAELRKNSRKLRLQEKSFQVLLALLEQRGRLVQRAELRQRLWPGDTFVDFENGLNTAVSKLREVLSDSAEQHRYIETLPRRGYRFVSLVEEVGGSHAIQDKELDIQKRRVDSNIVVVEIAGCVTLGCQCQQIESLVADILSQGEKKIVIDITDVTRVDSTGVGIIVLCSATVKRAGGQLCVAGARGPVNEILRMTHVGEIVPLYPTTAAALEGYTTSDRR